MAGSTGKATETGHVAKPLPDFSGPNREFFDKCREGQLCIQRCKNCHNTQFYPKLLCSECLSLDVEWMRCSGKAKVHTFTIIRRAPSEAFQADVPYVVAIVKLAEGPQMMANIINCNPDEVRCDMDIKVVFQPAGDGNVVPQFAPAS